MSLQECPQARGATTTWTAERTNLLKKLWSDGKSATMIARELGGVTRNAVIGKKERLGLAKRKSTQLAWPHCVEPRRDHGSGAVRSIDHRLMVGNIPLPKLKISAAPFLGLTLMQLKPDQCRYSRSEQSPYLFCGQPVKEDSSYCPHCHALTHRVV